MAIKKTKTPVVKKQAPKKAAAATPKPEAKPEAKPKPEPKAKAPTKAKTAGELLEAFATEAGGKDAATKAKLKIQLKKDLASLKAK